LPGYVLLNNDRIPNGGCENFSSAFLPATNTATLLRAKGATIDAENAMITDQSVAALIFDLKQRGLFDDTIVIWAGLAKWAERHILLRFQKPVAEITTSTATASSSRAVASEAA